jgi:cellulose synthase/poly-beta-1,6-N-acetylglucosamine synthase-like glycosyltransferase
MVMTEILYLGVSFLLALYGFNTLYLILLYYRSKKRIRLQPVPVAPTEWPMVTVQLPLYNEVYMVERLLKAVNAFDYPRSRLQIQVLDDSTDETTTRAAAFIHQLSASGLNIVHLHRSDRTGYKAGALKAGMESATGEFIAIFDADFIPPRDFLRKAIPWFSDPRVGCVQGQWGHTNRNYSLLTRLQALAVDAHGTIIQAARSRNGLFVQFTGTAGMFRRKCLEEAGGWQADTQTEDFDLCLRAQLQGWRFEYRPELIAPAELPVQMAAFKNQQARWSRGSIQTTRKILFPLLRSSQPVRVKIQAVAMLLQYLMHPLALTAFLLTIALSIQHISLPVWTAALIIPSAAVPLLYLSSDVRTGYAWWKRVGLTLGLLLLGIGISLSDSKAILEGLFSKGSGVFLRTPKFAVQREGETWEYSGYVLGQQPGAWAETVIGLATWVYAWICGQWDVKLAIWLMFFGLGFLLVSAITLAQSPGLMRRKDTQKKNIDQQTP